MAMDMSVKLNQSQAVNALHAATGPQSSPQLADVSALTPMEQPKRAELEKAVTDIREFVQSSKRNLDFSIDDSTGRVVVKVVATESGEVIRQLPSEAALKLAASLSDASSLLFDAKV
ncbi:flagellar protein FlaG [compost metagenome]